MSKHPLHKQCARCEKMMSGYGTRKKSNLCFDCMHKVKVYNRKTRGFDIPEEWMVNEDE